MLHKFGQVHSFHHNEKPQHFSCNLTEVQIVNQDSDKKDFIESTAKRFACLCQLSNQVISLIFDGQGQMPEFPNTIGL